jgi:hypothetical protein
VLAGGVGWRCWLAVRRARCLPARRLKLKQNLKLRQNLKDSTQHVRSTQQHTAHSTAAPCSTQRSSTQTTRPVALSRIRSVHQFSQFSGVADSLAAHFFFKILAAISPSPSHVAQKAKPFALCSLTSLLGLACGSIGLSSPACSRHQSFACLLFAHGGAGGHRKGAKLKGY